MDKLTRTYRRRLALVWAAEAAILLGGLWRRAYIVPSFLLLACAFAGIVFAERERAAFAELFRSRYPERYQASERPRGCLGFPRPLRACPVPEDLELEARWRETERAARVSSLALLGCVAADMALLAGLALGGLFY